LEFGIGNCWEFINQSEQLICADISSASENMAKRFGGRRAPQPLKGESAKTQMLTCSGECVLKELITLWFFLENPVRKSRSSTLAGARTQWSPPNYLLPPPMLKRIFAKDIYKH